MKQVYCPIKRRKAYEARVSKKRTEVFTGRTYGEVWWEFLNHPDYFKGDDLGRTPAGLPKRMKPQEAIRYYKTKLQAVWDELYPPKPRDFLKLDDYFDSFEAKRCVNNIILGVAV